MPGTCLDRPVAYIAPFPLDARTDLVRRCARELSGRHGPAAVEYWRNLCRSLAEELVAAGCETREAGRQVLSFQSAVQAEMVALHEERHVLDA